MVSFNISLGFQLNGGAKQSQFSIRNGDDIKTVAKGRARKRKKKNQIID